MKTSDIERLYLNTPAFVESHATVLENGEQWHTVRVYNNEIWKWIQSQNKTQWYADDFTYGSNLVVREQLLTAMILKWQ